MKWIVFCSQTGSEIIQLSDELNRIPDLIITNCYDNLSPAFHTWQRAKNIELTIIPNMPNVEDYWKVLIYPKSSLITLHGYLRIIPKEICNKYNIYNGHPGLINYYPELKGKDPQIKAFNVKHRTIGSVVHKVTETIDSGDIVSFSFIILDSDEYPLNSYYFFLKETSIIAWKRFLLQFKYFKL